MPTQIRLSYRPKFFLVLILSLLGLVCLIVPARAPSGAASAQEAATLSPGLSADGRGDASFKSVPTPRAFPGGSFKPAAGRAAAAQDAKPRQGISKFLRSHELLKMNPVQVAERVRRTGRLSISTPGRSFELELIPNDLRAPDYRAEEVGGGVVRPVPAGRVRTFKGVVVGVEGAYARFTVAEDTFEGTISTRDERFYVEPLKRYSGSAGAGDFVLYRASDVLGDAGVACGVTLDGKIESAARFFAPGRAENSAQQSPPFSPRAVVELATEADYEFVTLFGNSENANNEILSIMNQVDGIYEAEIGLNFRIVYQHTWATSADPYDSLGATSALSEFKNYWEANMGGVARDAAHLWTGRNVGVAGIAYLNSVCRSTTSAYGLTNATIQHYYKVSTTAHEIGHNLGATHQDEVPSPDIACFKTIMWSYADALVSLTTFCPASRDQITTFISSNNCPLFNNISGQITDSKGSSISGVVVTLSGSKSATTLTDFAGKYNFGHLALGGSYTVTPTKNNYTFTPPAQTVASFGGAQTVNFAAAPTNFYTVSGRLTAASGDGLPGVAVTLSGSQLNTVQTDAGGNYKFEHVGEGGNYTVAPPRVGYTFSPPSQTFTNLGGDQTGVNFSGAKVLFPIQGRVWVSGTTTPISGVTVTLTGDGSATTTTDSNGLFSLGTFPGFGNYTIFLSKPGYTFGSSRTNLFNINGAQNWTFYGIQFYTIAASVLDDAAAPIPGVTMTLTGSHATTTQTDGNGAFSFPDLPVDGTYTFTPSKPGYTFTPASRTASQLGVLEGNYSFRGRPLYSVQGKVTAAGGAGLGEVSVNLVGTQSATTYSLETDSAGNYNFTKTPPPDIYTVVPSKPGYVFTPATRTINTTGSQQTADFSASAAPTPSPTPAPTPLPFTPGANGKIAHTRQTNGRPEIYTMNPDGTGQTKLTNGANGTASDWRPVWSPDGSKILFERFQNNQSDIYLMNANGSDQRRLTTDVSFDGFPTWSPDGTRIAFSSGRNNPQQSGRIYVMNVDGTGLVRISPNNIAYDIFPAWSPDGTRIAFVSGRDGNNEIYTMNPDGTDVRRLTNHPASEGGVVWSPDSTKLAFYSSRNGNNEIFVMNADGSGQTRLTTASLSDTDPAWSRDGQKIAFVTLRVSPTTVGGVVVMNADGTNQTFVLNDFSINHLSWQPLFSTNPIDDAEFFVRQHYLDFLNRQPDASGLGFWANEITSCGTNAQCREVKRINVSAAFFLSIEFQQTGYLAYRAHKAAFGNLTGKPVPVTREEMLQDMQVIGNGVIVNADGWEQKLEQNKQAYFTQLAASARFTALYSAALTPEQFVDALNSNAGGALSQGERDALAADLRDNVKTRAQALRAVAEDADLSRAEFNKAFVLMQYFGYLRRDPNGSPDTDFAGYNFWLGKLNEFNGNFIRAEMVKAFLSSIEYRNRFGQ